MSILNGNGNPAFFPHVWHLTVVGVDWLTITSGFSPSLASLHIGFLTFCFCQRSNFTSAYNFIYISPNSLSNKGHSSRQLQGHVLERGLALYVHVFMHTCVRYVCVVNSKKPAHTLYVMFRAAEMSKRVT